MQLEHSAIFVDCGYLQNDVEEIIKKLSLMLKQ